MEVICDLDKSSFSEVFISKLIEVSLSGKLIGSLGWRSKRGLKGTEVRTGEEELKR